MPAGERQEVHVGLGWVEIARPREWLHDQAAHVRHLQPGGQERLQGLQDPGLVL